jgi:hypothetical protein
MTQLSFSLLFFEVGGSISCNFRRSGRSRPACGMICISSRSNSYTSLIIHNPHLFFQHVVDSTAPNLEEHRTTVLQVLQQIGVSEEKLQNMIEVWNKVMQFIISPCQNKN